jgi:hypothetical protein
MGDQASPQKGLGVSTLTEVEGGEVGSNVHCSYMRYTAKEVLKRSVKGQQQTRSHQQARHLQWEKPQPTSTQQSSAEPVGHVQGAERVQQAQQAC